MIKGFKFFMIELCSSKNEFFKNYKKEVCFFAIGFWVNWQPGNFDTK